MHRGHRRRTRGSCWGIIVLGYDGVVIVEEIGKDLEVVELVEAY